MTPSTAPPIKPLSVRDVMSKPVLTVEITESLWDAWQLLFVSGLRHLVVVDEDGSCLGVLSDRNILADVPAAAEHLQSRTVGDIMSRVPPVRVLPTDAPSVAARLMNESSVEAVPVIDERERLLGIVTESDLVRLLVQ